MAVVAVVIVKGISKQKCCRGVALAAAELCRDLTQHGAHNAAGACKYATLKYPFILPEPFFPVPLLPWPSGWWECTRERVGPGWWEWMWLLVCPGLPELPTRVSAGSLAGEAFLGLWLWPWPPLLKRRTQNREV